MAFGKGHPALDGSLQTKESPEELDRLVLCGPRYVLLLLLLRCALLSYIAGDMRMRRKG